MAKTVTKSALAKTTAKPAPRAAAKATPGVKQMFILSDAARPKSGGLLFAHTLSALFVLGMMDSKRAAVSTNALTAVVGKRAVSYHTNEKSPATMEAVGDKTRLTPAGLAFFSDRATNGQAAKDDFDAFVSIMTRGKVPDSFTAVKPNHVIPVGLSL